MTKNIIIYSSTICPNCIKLKNLLKKNSIQYTEKNIADSDSLTELAVNNIFTNIVPILKIENEFYTHKVLFNKDEINENFILNEINK